MNKRRIYTITILMAVAVLTWLIIGGKTTTTESPELAKVALREVGNQLLLEQQDSTSLVNPAIQTEASSYQLSFEKPLSFRPGSLVNNLASSFEKLKLPDTYLVETIDCENHEVAYSFKINASKEKTLVPCVGRVLPLNCYLIKVQFEQKENTLYKAQWYLYLLLFLTFVAIEVYFYRSKTNTNLAVQDANFEAIGSFKFYPEQNKLIKEAIEIGLSKKECELLAILIASPNQVIKRDELTKRVWEDNGVIVGRSLDTYISKLRKKLSQDERIKITNVHGVGYKLEIKG